MFEIVLKQVEPQRVASIRTTIPSFQSVTPLLDEVYEYVEGFNVRGVKAAIWHVDGPQDDKPVECEALVILEDVVPENSRVSLYDTPAMTMASLEHRGAYNRLPEAYGAMMNWIQENDYQIVGPGREIYHVVTAPVRQDDGSYVTEIQFPVLKKQ